MWYVCGEYNFFLMLVIKLNNNKKNTKKQEYFLYTNEFHLTKIEMYPVTAKNQTPWSFQNPSFAFSTLVQVEPIVQNYSIFCETRHPTAVWRKSSVEFASRYLQTLNLTMDSEYTAAENAII